MKENIHYELTDETIEFDGHTLHRIKCTEDLLGIRRGDFGGFVEGYENLCDEAWVGGDAKVYGGAVVNSTASVYDDACVSDSDRNPSIFVHEEECISPYLTERDYNTFVQSVQAAGFDWKIEKGEYNGLGSYKYLLKETII